MANAWSIAAGKYFKQQRKTRKDLSFGDALKELSALKKKGQMPTFGKSSSKKSSSKKSRSKSSRKSRRSR